MTVSLQHRFHPPEVLSCSLHTPPSFTCWLVPLQFPSLYQSCSVHVPVLSILFLLMTLIFAWQRPPQSYWTLVTYCGYALTVGVTKQTDFLVDRFNMLHINACKNRFRSLLKYDKTVKTKHVYQPHALNLDYRTVSSFLISLTLAFLNFPLRHKYIIAHSRYNFFNIISALSAIYFKYDWLSFHVWMLLWNYPLWPEQLQKQKK